MIRCPDGPTATNQGPSNVGERASPTSCTLDTSRKKPPITTSDSRVSYMPFGATPALAKWFSLASRNPTKAPAILRAHARGHALSESRGPRYHQITPEAADNSTHPEQRRQIGTALIHPDSAWTAEDGTARPRGFVRCSYFSVTPMTDTSVARRFSKSSISNRLSELQ